MRQTCAPHFEPIVMGGANPLAEHERASVRFLTEWVCLGRLSFGLPHVVFGLTPSNVRPIIAVVSVRASNSKPATPCPSCRSTNTVRTNEHLGEQMFFCVACEHSWSVLPETPSPKQPKS